MRYAKFPMVLFAAAAIDVKPIIVDTPKFETLQRAIQVAESLQWEVKSVNPGKGTINATDATQIFGPEDNVEIRIKPEDGKSRVEAISITKADTDPKRFQVFLRRLEKQTH